jgi:hypothetical protein
MNGMLRFDVYTKDSSLECDHNQRNERGSIVVGKLGPVHICIVYLFTFIIYLRQHATLPRLALSTLYIFYQKTYLAQIKHLNLAPAVRMGCGHHNSAK